MVDRTLSRIFILAGLALFGWLIFILKPVVIPFIAAFVIAYLFSGLVGRLAKMGLPRWLATSIVFIGIGVGVFLQLGILFLYFGNRLFMHEMAFQMLFIGLIIRFYHGQRKHFV